MQKIQSFDKVISLDFSETLFDDRHLRESKMDLLLSFQNDFDHA